MDTRKVAGHTRIALRIVAIYVVVAALWILFSDMLLDALVYDKEAVVRLSLLKGWFYVAATGLLLTLLIRRDVAAITRSETALMQSEQYYRGVFENAHDAIIIFDPDGEVVLDANERACEMYGWSRDQFIAMSLESVTHDVDHGKSHLGKILEPGGAVQFESVHYRKDGSKMFLDIHATTVDYRGRAAVLTINRDITERKAYEARLREHAASQAQMLKQLTSAQEDERRRISMELHDGPLQSLGVAMMELHRAAIQEERGHHEESVAELSGLRSTLTSTISELRALLSDLSLELLTSYGLESALRGYADRFSAGMGLQVDLDYRLPARLPGETELLLYRICQEALANAGKHAHATKVAVSLYAEDERAWAVISDDGTGFDPDLAVRRQQEAGHGLGLRSMLQRAREAQGKLEIESTQGKGTTLRFWCPLVTLEP
jgi:PAS domain S-box-containing protein